MGVSRLQKELHSHESKILALETKTDHLLANMSQVLQFIKMQMENQNTQNTSSTMSSSPSPSNSMHAEESHHSCIRNVKLELPKFSSSNPL